MTSLSDLEEFARPVTATVVGPTFAQQFPAEYKWIQTSTFGFAVKMRDVLKEWGGLTPGQLAAVRKCMAFAAQQKPAQPIERVPLYRDVNALDLRHVPAGMYAVPDGHTRLKVKIAKPDEGKWAGWIFVNDGAEYGQGTRYGAQRPDGKYQGQIVEQLTAIAANPAAASAAYGKLTGTCGVCGRHLENKESVARGIGPICAGRMGW